MTYRTTIFNALLLCFLPTTTAVFQKTDKCANVLANAKCEELQNLGHCQKNPRMKEVCKMTCGYCSKDSCKDQLSKTKCDHLKLHYSCLLNQSRMKLLCPETCGFCNAKCIDRRQDCLLMRREGQCNADPPAMKNDCPASCDFCGPKSLCDDHECPASERCILQEDGTPACVCRSRCKYAKETGPVCASNGETFKSLCQMFQSECESKEVLTVQYYGACESEYTCEDDRFIGKDTCELLKSDGQCERNKEVMEFYCAQTCQLCRQPAPPPSCANSPHGCCWNSDAPALGPHGSGCRPCEDSLVLCRFFQASCGGPANSDFMKKYCPATCRYCVMPDTPSRLVQV